MSNPLLTSLLLRDSLQGRDRDGVFSATATGPVRYDDDGLIVEPGTTNYALNPVGVGVLSDAWSVNANCALDAVALPAPLPPELVGAGIDTCFRVTMTDNLSPQLLASGAVAPLSATGHVFSWLVYVPSAVTASIVQVTANNYVGASSAPGTVDLSLRDQWQWVVGSITPAAGDLSGQVGIRFTGGTMQSGESIYWVAPQMQAGSVRTSFVPWRDGMGNILPGYSWAGTPHASASVRAATNASIVAAGHINTLHGSVFARTTPHYDTGAAQRVMVTGITDTGDRLVVDPRSSGVARIVSNVSGATGRTASTTEAAIGDRSAVYAEWDAASVGIALNSGSKTTTSRVETPTGVNAGTLITIGKNDASSLWLGGSLSDLLIYDAPLSDARRAIVLDALEAEATEDDLWALFETGSPYTFFQLRPY